MAILLTSVSAQSVRATVDTSEVYVGESFEYRIVIDGSTDSTVPELPLIDGIDTAYKGASTTMVSSIGTGSGSTTRTVAHSWSFTPRKIGQISIPSVAVEVNGTVFYTKSGVINVKKPEPIEGFHLSVESDKKEYWLGEPVYLTIKWLISPGIKVASPAFNIPFINDGSFTAQNQNPPPGNDVYKIDIAGMEVLIMQSAEIYDGKQFTSLSFRLKLISDEAGIYNLQPISLAFDLAEQTSGFRTKYSTKVIPSNAVDFSIKKLPEDAPDNIILSAGKLTVESSATPTRVHIGDPLTFKIQISGALIPEKVILPQLKNYRQMDQGFTIPERRSPAEFEGDSVIFKQTLRVKNEEQKAIPSLVIPYFNTETGQVEKAYTPAIPIEVLETQIVTSEDLENTGYMSNPDKETNQVLTQNDSGLKHNYTVDQLLDTSDDLSVFFLIISIISAVVFVVLFIYTKQPVFNSSRNDDFSNIYEQLKNSDPRTINRSIRDYLHKYVNKENRTLTPDEMFECLLRKGNSPEVSESIRHCLADLEQAVYSKNCHVETSLVLEDFKKLSKALV
ncbi:BatD family protein [Spirochaeta isovalerica]|uniref:Protein BatD n=1 Tax=Spirochaeta isovalerica TaxID=150 RepID=A0A841R6U3_9SPIO|nr:BatD family protein [Spirochaeta isovalerica]MBB6478760.1 hypothetical protein [Spirochaeta isovalerica]